MTKVRKIDLEIIKNITKLQNKTEKELRKIWFTMFDLEPEIMSRKYMISKLAYKMQELVYGSLDADTEAKIKACANETFRKKTLSSKNHSKFNPLVGTKIIKKHGEKIYEVLVVNDGFAFEGIVYKSLSAIATKITGTKWNGLKFFNVAK